MYYQTCTSYHTREIVEPVRGHVGSIQSLVQVAGVLEPNLTVRLPRNVVPAEVHGQVQIIVVEVMEGICRE